MIETTKEFLIVIRRVILHGTFISFHYLLTSVDRRCH